MLAHTHLPCGLHLMPDSLAGKVATDLEVGDFENFICGGFTTIWPCLQSIQCQEDKPVWENILWSTTDVIETKPDVTPVWNIQIVDVFNTSSTHTLKIGVHWTPRWKGGREVPLVFLVCMCLSLYMQSNHAVAKLQVWGCKAAAVRSKIVHLQYGVASHTPWVRFLTHTLQRTARRHAPTIWYLPTSRSMLRHLQAFKTKVPTLFQNVPEITFWDILSRLTKHKQNKQLQHFQLVYYVLMWPTTGWDRGGGVPGVLSLTFQHDRHPACCFPDHNMNPRPIGLGATKIHLITNKLLQISVHVFLQTLHMHGVATCRRHSTQQSFIHNIYIWVVFMGLCLKWVTQHKAALFSLFDPCSWGLCSKSRGPHKKQSYSISTWSWSMMIVVQIWFPSVR